MVKEIETAIVRVTNTSITIISVLLLVVITLFNELSKDPFWPHTKIGLDCLLVLALTNYKSCNRVLRTQKLRTQGLLLT